MGMWMGLFTGARASEIGQLALDDFFDVDGIPCLRITDEGVGQSTKNEASNRIIPVHPEFIRMGLVKRVERLRAAGEKRLFPKAGRRAPKSGAAINGQGDWLSKAFGRHLSAILPKPDTGKLGFHSFRKTLISTSRHRVWKQSSVRRMSGMISMMSTTTHTRMTCQSSMCSTPSKN